MAEQIRVSDSDRDAVAATLREHFAHGRLTIDELNQRLDATFAARTWSELNRVTADLPLLPRAEPPSVPAGPRARSDQRHDRTRAGLLALPAVAFWLFLAFLLLFTLPGLGVFGWGPGRAIVILLAVLAVIRRLTRGLRRAGGCRRPRRRW